MPRNSYFKNNYPLPVHNPKFKEKHAMLYTKHKTKITKLPRKPNKIKLEKPNKIKEQSPHTLKQHIVLNVAQSQDQEQSKQSIKLDKCNKSKEGDRKKTP